MSAINDRTVVKMICKREQSKWWLLRLKWLYAWAFLRTSCFWSVMPWVWHESLTKKCFKPLWLIILKSPQYDTKHKFGWSLDVACMLLDDIVEKCHRALVIIWSERVLLVFFIWLQRVLHMYCTACYLRTKYRAKGVLPFNLKVFALNLELWPPISAIIDWTFLHKRVCMWSVYIYIYID